MADRLRYASARDRKLIEMKEYRKSHSKQLREYGRSYYKKHAGDLKSAGREYYSKHSTARKENARMRHKKLRNRISYRVKRSAYARKYNSRPYVVARRRDRHLQARYGISLADYNNLFKEQGGLCAIHGEVSLKPLLVDHDHRTGKVRGLICRNCNLGIGHLGDNLLRVKQAVAYLERYEEDSNVIVLRKVA